MKLLDDDKIIDLSELFKMFGDSTRVKIMNVLINGEMCVSDISENTYKIENTEYSSYIVTLDWSYEKDYGYETSTKITLIKKDNKLFIVEKVSNNE